MRTTARNDTPRGFRGILLAILCLGTLGTGAELLILGHDEDALQFIPLAAIGLAIAVIAWHAVDGRRLALRMLQATMLLFIGAGIAGIVLHFRSNREFQLEMDASLRGRGLFWKALQAKSPPPLAPGVMVQLGLLGLAYAYGHPAGIPPSDDTTPKGA